MQLFIKYLFIGFCMLYTMSTHADSKLLLSIEESLFARGIDEESKSYVKQVDGVFSGKPPLYFWARVQGNREAFERLVAEKKLPIMHKWTRISGIHSIHHLDDKEYSELELIPTGLDDETVLNAFRHELKTKNNFDFRIWSKKENIPKGRYTVELLYQGNEAVMCGDKPCIKQICVNINPC